MLAIFERVQYNKDITNVRRKDKAMVYEIKVTQTVSGTIYVEGDNYEDAEKNARQFIKKDPKHVASIIFDETWITEVGSQEASDEASGETKTN